MASTGTSNFATNIDKLKSRGFIPVTIGDKIKVFLNMLTLLAAFLSYAIKVIVGRHEMDTQQLIETAHWSSVYLAVFFYGFQTLLKQNLVIEMDKIITDGFFIYDNFSQEQLKCRSDANLSVIKTTKMFTIIYWSAPLVLFVKFIFKGGYMDWEPMYPAYIPFEINTLLRYVCVLTFQVSISLCVTWSVIPHPCVLQALHTHLCAQLEILRMTIIDVFPPNTADSLKKQRIKQCVRHHVIIIQFFNKLQEFISLCSVSFAMTSAIMLCTLAYLIQSQKIGDMAYGTDWKSQSPSITKDMGMIMVASKKPLQLYGAKLIQYNRETLLDIIRTSYSYFNILNAMT